MSASIAPVAVDLIELASYVFAADQAIRRGGEREFDYGQRWRRRLHFVIPVRRPDIWQDDRVLRELRSTLTFLSDDEYDFKFVRYVRPPSLSGYLFEDDDQPDFEEVMLFSGGLDSLGGAVQEVLRGNRQVALVSHRPVSKLYAVQRNLVQRISERAGPSGRRPWHVATEVNKGQQLEADFTQRTRSFLFAALGAFVARSIGLRRIRFYENGVTSLNLPICGQLLGGRGSRTTHPKSLLGFANLFSLLFETDFSVENPFLWKTKADVVREIKASGHGELCAWTLSCSHTRSISNRQKHCGRCSQCLERRFSVIAADLDDSEDPAASYKSDVIVGECRDEDVILCERYVGYALQLEQMRSVQEFTAAFGELSRFYRHLEIPAEAAAEMAFDLHKRHASQVVDVLNRIIHEYSDEIVRRALPPRCLVSVICGRPKGSLAAVNPQEKTVHRSQTITVVNEQFEMVVGNKQCFFGNTKEFQVIRRLIEAVNNYLPYSTLLDDVWGATVVEPNTLQRTVSNIRRRLENDGINEVEIDGRQRGHYRLSVRDSTAG